VFRVVGVTSDITDRKEREREYEVTIEFLQELYDVATTTVIDIHEKITRLLRVGPEKLGLPYGYLTRIEVDHEDPTEGTQRVIEASGDHELLQPGNACPIAQSYCRKTIQTEGLAEVHNAVQAGWEDDPAYELFNLGCYIGSATRVDGDLYGTVFFASETPRDEPFTDAERTFVRLMSQLVILPAITSWNISTPGGVENLHVIIAGSMSYELERDRVTRELQSQNERLSEFTSIVSHDLRNPLSVAKGRLDLLAEDCESDHIEVIERAHARMETLITDLLTLARKGQAALEVTVVELVAAARKSWQNVDTGNATLVVDTDRTVRADEGQLRHLFENLFSNSVGHGGSGVTVTVGGLADGFYVADDGQGIPPKNRDDVFEPGYSTSERGTGFGLRIVERVVDGHGWTIQLVESETGGARFNITGVEEPAD
jgi:signal transduction histidine kinase